MKRILQSCKLIACYRVLMRSFLQNLKKKTWHNAVRTLKLLTLVSNIVVTFHCFLSSPAHTDLVFLSMIKFPSRKRREDGMMGASRSARTELSGFTKR